MKKGLLGILLMPLALAACDRPVAEFDVMPCCDLGDKIGMVNIAVYSDGHAVATAQGKKIKLDLDKTRIMGDYYSNSGTDVVYAVEWKGTMPDDGEDMTVSAHYNLSNHLLSIGYLGYGSGGGYGVDVYSPARIKALDEYVTSKDACLNNINNMVSVTSDGLLNLGHNVQIYLGDIKKGIVWARREIPASDAMQICEKWDTNSKDWWQTEGEAKITDAGMNPCETYARLKKYISDNKLKDEGKEVLCANPQQVHMTCQNVLQAGFQYLTFNKCDDGKGLLEETTDWTGYLLLSLDADGKTWRGGSVSMEADPVTGGYYVRDENRSGAAVLCRLSEALYPHQICARVVNSLTRVASDGRIELDVAQKMKPVTNGFELEQQFVPLTQEQAFDVSPNWDYKNLKPYTTGDNLHEMDACDALNELRKLRWEIKKDLDENK